MVSVWIANTLSLQFLSGRQVRCMYARAMVISGVLTVSKLRHQKSQAQSTKNLDSVNKIMKNTTLNTSAQTIRQKISHHFFFRLFFSFCLSLPMLLFPILSTVVQRCLQPPTHRSTNQKKLFFYSDLANIRDSRDSQNSSIFPAHPSPPCVHVLVAISSINSQLLPLSYPPPCLKTQRP